MPYIITIDAPNNQDDALSRVAVATLDQARDAVRGYTFGHIPIGEPVEPLAEGQTILDPTMGLPESGGTIGPLPDGTVIEVASVDWADLPPIAEARKRYPSGDGRSAVIRAYNDAQGA